MAEASSVDTARFAFRKRDKRFVLTGASIAYLIGSLVLAAAFFAAVWPVLSPIATWYLATIRTVTEGGEPAPPPMQSVLVLAPWYVAYGLLKLLLFAAYEAACLRWLVRGERGGLLGLSLGADTWRVYATYFVWFALGLAFAVLVCAFYVGLVAASRAAPALRLVMMLAGALAPLAFAALVIGGATRLSPAAATSIARRRFAFFGAWRATRGRFWEMLGAFVILLAVYLAIAMVLSALIRIPMTQALYPIMSEAAAEASFAAIVERLMTALASPPLMASLALYGIASITLAMLLYVAWFGVNARVAAEAEPSAAASATPGAPAAPAATEAPAAPPAPPPSA